GAVREGAKGSQASSPLTAPAAKEVGDPCVSTDGWQPASYGSAPPDGSAPMAVSMHGVAYTSRDQLAPGVGFCLPPGGIYPAGYFTMNCKGDRDCPGNAQCDSAGLCRKPCSSNADCQKPATCSQRHPTLPLRHCVFPAGDERDQNSQGDNE